MEQITGSRLPITHGVVLEGALAASSGHIMASFLHRGWIDVLF